VAKKVSFEVVLLLQFGVGLFLATLGIAGITHYNSDLSEFGRAVNRLFGSRNDPTSLVIAVIELVAGIGVLCALFVPVRGKALRYLTLAVTVLWLVYLVVVAARTAFEPDFVSWLNTLAADVVILVALWMVNRRYS
jgi:hypothetical protein